MKLTIGLPVCGITGTGDGSGLSGVVGSSGTGSGVGGLGCMYTVHVPMAIGLTLNRTIPSLHKDEEKEQIMCKYCIEWQIQYSTKSHSKVQN